MKVAIFGAAGSIGKHAVWHALDKGYQVKAYVRDTSKLMLEHENLTIIQGEINDYENVSETVKGCNAVIWCVGIPMKKYTGTPSLDGHKVLIKAMADNGVFRLIDWATPSVPFKNDKKSFITVVPGLLAGILYKQGKAEMIAIGELVANSGLDWTLVRFMAPKDTLYTGKVKVGFGDVKMSFNISRSDIAAFMVEQVTDKQYIHSMPIIGS
ncbi:MAG: NAD(P)H-binding protein [Tannerella sp.]|jgi:putative NADH-flavin reductase|nr:NAD(P)H-binding protein [Tannerella sp.]